ncbi:hypothetical protein [Qaidamihabitans albus]|uniref:hypothetical protein n=1 Tax=Qaidamihabitans albus TaxID=2795733 RepID=UPI0018F2103B|nr:hypothetical protein [Qaidamihabitans albus]
MSEHEVREALVDAVADEPPLNFDPDELIGTVRERTRRRRAVWSAGAGVALVAALAVAVPLALGGPGEPGSTQAAAGSRAPSAPAAPAAPAQPGWPPDNVEPTRYTEAELRQRGEEMRTHLRDRFPAVVPEAADVEVGEFSGEATGSVTEGQRYLNSFVRFTADGAPTAVNVQVNAAGADMPPPGGMCEAEPSAECTVQVQPDESVLVLVEHSGVGNGPDMKVTTAYHYRTDGVVLMVSGYNYDPTAGAETDHLPDLTVTTAQLIELASDPALRL